MMPPPLSSKKIKGSPSSSSNSQKEERENEGNRNNEGKGERRSETSLIYDGLYYTYAHGFVSVQSGMNFAS